MNPVLRQEIRPETLQNANSDGNLPDSLTGLPAIVSYSGSRTAESISSPQYRNMLRGDIMDTQFLSIGARRLPIGLSS